MAELDKNQPLLAGPIVRRVSTTNVNVWIATHKKINNLKLSVFNRKLDTSISGGTSRCTTIEMGENMFLSLLSWDAPPSSPLKEGNIYEYTIAGDGVPGLFPTSINLPGFQRPSFMTPAKIGVGDADVPGLRVVQASCRKPHGGGQDGLALAAELLNNTAEAPGMRPCMLFLTGDQIYADDVHTAVLGQIYTWRGLLFGWTEELGLVTELPNPAEALRTLQGTTEATTRHQFLQDVGFKHATGIPDEYHYYSQHLLTFQEWSTMYLLCWSEVLWKNWKSGVVANEQVDTFVNTLPRVRKVLANIATYMIFDDHDVTDDWFQKEQRALIGKSKFLVPRRIVRNGLLAYMYFQAWGNSPGQFEDLRKLHPSPTAPQKNIVDNILKPRYLVYPDPGREEEERCLHQILGNLSDNSKPRLHWHYRVEGPGFTAIVLDGRTWRGPFNPAEPQESLITLDGMNKQMMDIRAGDIVLLVAPAPVGGFRVVDTAQAAKMSLVRSSSSLLLREPEEIAWDYEGWYINRSALRHLFYLLTKFKTVVLSGDVHYAYSQWVRFKSETGLSRMLQLCSSASKNSEDLTRLLGLSDIPTSVIPNPGEAPAVSPETLLLILADLGIAGNSQAGYWTDLLGLRERINMAARRFQEILRDPVNEGSAALKDFWVGIKEDFVRAEYFGWDTSTQLLYCVRWVWNLNNGHYTNPDIVSSAQKARDSHIDITSITDLRGNKRYWTGWYNRFLAGIPSHDDVVKWYQKYETLQSGHVAGTAFLEHYNFLSVGDGNVGVINIRTRSGTTEVAHTLMWALPRKPTEFSGYSDGYPTSPLAWGTTLHYAKF